MIKPALDIKPTVDYKLIEVVLSMLKISCVFVLIFCVIANANESGQVLNQEQRLKIFNSVVSELERIDGEGLPPRKNRPEKWETTVNILREQAKNAQTAVDFGQVFRKLDATYPNLHAQVVLNESYDIAPRRLRPRIAVKFGADIVIQNQKNFQYKISSIETDLMKDFRETIRPAIGDDLLAINGRPLKDWSRENFIYCKFPLRSQCEMNFFDHFRKGLLSWDWRSPLEYTIRRNNRIWSIKVPVEIPVEKKQVSGQTHQSEPDSECAVEPDRYFGFKPIYGGLNICVFESEKWSEVTVLRISSFRYRELPQNSKIKSLKDEVEQFYNSYWKEKAPKTKKLIIDVIDNGGGDVPVAWYQIFYEKQFQEAYVQFKKISELEDKNIRKELFYGDAGKEIWFNDLKKNETYTKIKMGQFLPSIPQFCVYEDQSCAKGLFPSRPNGFKGQVRVLVNEWCISTCSGFVWSMKDQLGKRVKLVGIPDSGDTAYARLFLDVLLDHKNTNGFRVEISSRPGGSKQILPDGAILRQQLTATRSTDSKGRLISAIPSKVDIWVPYRYRNFDNTWESSVLKEALKN